MHDNMYSLMNLKWLFDALALPHKGERRDTFRSQSSVRNNFKNDGMCLFRTLQFCSFGNT